MLKRIFIPLILLLLFVHREGATAPSYITFSADVDWVTRTSDHFEILYRRGHDGFADRVLVSAEKAYRLLTPIFPEAPEKTYIVLVDFRNSMNGYSVVFPWPHMVLFAVPPTPTSVLSGLDDWLDSLVLHEFVHTLHLYPATGLYGPLRFIFGSLIVPNGLMPSHLHEGMATHFETHFSKQGRGAASHFQMYRRMAVNADLWKRSEWGKLDRMDGGRSFWPQGAAPYFFGYFLHEELWKRKGAKGIRDVTLSYSNNWPYFIHTPAEEVYGEDYNEIWDDIFEKTGAQQRKEIQKILSKPQSKLRYLTQNGFQKKDVAISQDGSLVAFRTSHPDEKAHIEVISLPEGKMEKPDTAIKGDGEGLCWIVQNGKKELHYAGSGTLDSRAVNVMKVTTKERWSTLGTADSKDQKVVPHDVSSCPFSSQAQRYYLVASEFAGQGKVTRFEIIPKEEDKVDTDKKYLRALHEWKLPVGKWTIGLLAGPTDWIAIRNRLSTEFYRWDPGKEPRLVFIVRGHAYQLRWDKDRKRILAIADLHGRNEVWRFDPQKKTVQKRLAFLGGVNSFDVHADTAIVSTYRHGGYDIAYADWVNYPAEPIANYRPEPVENTPKPDINISETKDYSPLGTLFPRTWIPSIYFVPDGTQFGVFIPGFDISQRHHYTVFGGYDTRGLPFANVGYNYRVSKDYTLGVNPSFLPSYIQSTRSFFKTWGATISLSSYWDWLKLNWNLAGVFRRVESSDLGPAIQSVGARLTLGRSFGVKTHPRAVAPIQGTKLSLSHSQFFTPLGSDDAYFSTTASIDQYVEAPWWDSHVMHFRLRGGYTEGTRLYNSFFQGGGELLIAQFMPYFLNRGFLPGSFLGRRIATANFAYKFPITRVDRGPGLFPAFLQRLHAEIIADAVTVDTGINHEQERASRQRRIFKYYFGSVGAVLASSWKFGYYLPVQIRLGGYHGFGRFGENIYLTLGIFASL